jgi:hypothetical protein
MHKLWDKLWDKVNALLLLRDDGGHIGGLDSPPRADKDAASGACCLGMLAFVVLIFVLGIAVGWACL